MENLVKDMGDIDFMIHVLEYLIKWYENKTYKEPSVTKLQQFLLTSL